MIFRKQPTAGLTLAFLATTFSAQAAFGVPLLGKKKTDQEILPARKLTASQNQLIDKAIAREKEVDQDHQGARSSG